MKHHRKQCSVLLSMQGGQLLRVFHGHDQKNLNSGRRGSIHGFSRSAGGRMRRYLRCSVADYSTIGTLTYPSEYPGDGQTVKQHWRRLVQRMLRRCNRQAGIEAKLPFSIFWFLEFQERGAPHIHFFCTRTFGTGVDGENEIKSSRQWLAQTWYEICDSGDEKHLRAGTQFDFLKKGRAGTISYASKYAGKVCQKKVPENFENVGRFWGVSGDRRTVSADMVLDADDLANENVRELLKLFKNDLNAMKLRGEIKERRNGPIMACWIGLTIKAQKRLKAKFSLLQAKLSFEISMKYYDEQPYDILTGWTQADFVNENLE